MPATPTPTRTSDLSPALRAAAMAAVTAYPVDVLVIGGGVVGAGIALDAASRGLTVCLVEQNDWAAGTSSRSSKLIHGGLRYLEMHEFHLVFEALSERSRLLSTIAPHLVHPIEFCYPLTGPTWERPYTATGLSLYDAFSRVRSRRGHLPRHRHLTARQVRGTVPALHAAAHHGAQLYHDAGVDDARFVLALVRTAAAYGAHCLNKTTVTQITHDPAGRADGAVIVDTTTAASHRIHARHVICAVGASTDAVAALTGTPVNLHVTASKGTHILVPRHRINSPYGLTLRTDTSVLFAIPWGQHWIIGTTDTPWHEPAGMPVTATPDDVTYLLDTINRVLTDPLTRDDVIAAYAGLRPLVTPDASGSPADTTATSRISREHTVTTTTDGVVLIAGGKYTTYRVMAVDAVNVATASRSDVPPSRTATLPLIGAHRHAQMLSETGDLAASHALDPGQVRQLVARHGDQTPAVLAHAATDPAALTPLPGAPQYLRAEILHAVRSEDATTLEDVLTRRTRISIETPDQGLIAAGVVADMMARELN